MNLDNTINKKACYICQCSNRLIDNHHYDCREGKLSPETVPLCRRCHRTYHDRGIEWFDDEYLDRAIEVGNRRREILNCQPQCVNPFPLLTRADIRRSDYWNKIHGIKPTRENVGTQTPAFPFHLPHGEPLCGWDWVNAHLYDLINWVPRIEIVHLGYHLTADIDSKKKLKDTVKAIRTLKGSSNG